MSDLLAGITVGLVALPLAMAFAIASGVPPSRGSKLAIDITGLKLLNGQTLPLRGYSLRRGGGQRAAGRGHDVYSIKATTLPNELEQVRPQVIHAPESRETIVSKR